MYNLQRMRHAALTRDAAMQGLTFVHHICNPQQDVAITLNSQIQVEGLLYQYS